MLKILISKYFEGEEPILFIETYKLRILKDEIKRNQSIIELQLYAGEIEQLLKTKFVKLFKKKIELKISNTQRHSEYKIKIIIIIIFQ